MSKHRMKLEVGALYKIIGRIQIAPWVHTSKNVALSYVGKMSASCLIVFTMRFNKMS